MILTNLTKKTFFNLLYDIVKTIKMSKNLLSLLVVVLLILSLNNNAFSQNLPLTTDSRIRTLVYNPNEVYELKFFYGYQSFIEFGEDEEIEMISIGEGFAWRLTPVGKRLFIRALEIAAHTNMIITTNHRIYHFDIRSGEYDGRADEELVYTVRFFYPQISQVVPLPPQITVPNQIIRQNYSDPKIVMPSLSNASQQNNPQSMPKSQKLSSLNFDFTFAGEDNQIIPVKVYSNESQTMMEFTDNSKIIPEIAMIDENNNERKLKYVVKNGVVVLPVVAKQFTLRINRSLVCVFNNKEIAK